jgi:hypothetical protein
VIYQFLALLFILNREKKIGIKYFTQKNNFDIFSSDKQVMKRKGIIFA